MKINFLRGRGIITDITVIQGPATVSCPPGYDNDFLLTWPGTRSGCDCRGAINGSRTIQGGSCSSNQTAKGCTGIGATPKFALPQIPSADGFTKTGYQVCVKREKTVSYYETSELMDTAGNCKSGNTPCGGAAGAVSSGAYTMCIPSGKISACPLTSITAQNPGYMNASATYTDHGSIGFQKIYSTRTGNNLPIADVVTSIKHVCRNSYDVPYFGSGSGSPLLSSGDNMDYSCEGGADTTFDKIVRQFCPSFG